MQIRPTAFTIGLIIHFSIALFCVYTEFGIDSTKAIKKRTSIVRILVLGISIAVIIIAVFFITAWIDMYKNHRGHGEVTIIDNGTIYVEATTSAP